MYVFMHSLYVLIWHVSDTMTHILTKIILLENIDSLRQHTNNYQIMD